MPNIHTPQELDPAAAFEAMGQRLAGLTAAIDGLAVKFQEMHARDYSPELAKIEERFDAVRDVVEKLNHHPAMALTPKTIASQIEAAGRDGRQADHQAWERVRNDLLAAADSINGVVASARTEQKQAKWMAIAVGATLVVGLFLGAPGRDVIDWSAPGRWYWPEARAAKILGRDKWGAGERLLEVADVQRWQKVQAALRSIENQDARSVKSADRKANRVGSGRAKLQRRHASE
ncbi:hypothetical protein EDF57_106409 [Novosphingobium sp. PhB55]|uniref:DUF6118 family protein n=1 Tax=Novosphingobium sp. PhB55 TaxID=2485106 RepID=UPI00106561F7|nr:DUF6118 family protein [Novosphingobium sp. PhB55]TDW63447.1 hypothetical protein EDF57_106409 [Novosphingobium sp. PhB55]